MKEERGWFTATLSLARGCRAVFGQELKRAVTQRLDWGEGFQRDGAALAKPNT